jgi:CheY-like chemotaxis protein
MTNLMPLLIVEDDEDVKEMIAYHLQGVVDSVMFARDGMEALDIVRSRPLRAVVSDLKMPGMNGVELLQAIRGLGLDTPFVLVTGYIDPDYLIQSIRLHADDYLEKPYSPERLREVVAKLINRPMALAEPYPRPQAA